MDSLGTYTHVLNNASVTYIDHSRSHRSIATGAWGCGTFRHDVGVVYVVQAVAAALSGVTLSFYGSHEHCTAAYALYSKLNLASSSTTTLDVIQVW